MAGSGSEDRGGVIRAPRSGALVHENTIGVPVEHERSTWRWSASGYPSSAQVRGKQWSLDVACPSPGCGGTVHGGGIDPTGTAVDFLDRHARCDTCGGSFTVGWLHAN